MAAKSRKDSGRQVSGGEPSGGEPSGRGVSGGEPSGRGVSGGEPSGRGVSGGEPSGRGVSGREMQDAIAGKCRVREILDRVGDKWSLFVIFRLGSGSQRFTELKRGVDGISQRMLTVTLRGLERDGIVTRTVYPVVPPRVDYELTKMGQALIDAVGSLMAWADAHLDEVDAARLAYDARAMEPPLPTAPAQATW